VRRAETLNGYGRRIAPGAEIPPHISSANAQRGIFGDSRPIISGGMGIGDEDAAKPRFAPKPNLPAHHARNAAIWRPMEIKGKRG
jgi:hypothetical protein